MQLETSLKNYRQYFIDLTWSHWNRLGATGFGPANCCNVDPEALLLMTACIGLHESRLLEIMRQWLNSYGELISIQRVKALLRVCEKNSQQVETPEAQQIFKKLRAELRDAIPESQYKKWKMVFSSFEHALKPIGSAKKLKDTDTIIGQNTLLQLRHLFGPGVKADVIYVVRVLNQQEKNPFNLEISSPALSNYLGYNVSSVYRALDDLEKTGILKKESTGHKRIIFREIKPLLPESKIFEKCFVSWLPIVGMVIYLERLNRSFQERPSVNNKSIIKSRMMTFIAILDDLVHQAYIPVQTYPSIRQPLKDVPLEEIDALCTSTIKRIYSFITSSKWLG